MLRVMIRELDLDEKPYARHSIVSQALHHPDVEHFRYNQYFVVPKRESRFVSGELVDDTRASYLECPGCHKHHMGGIKHLDYTVCSCGLYLLAAGNCLGVWKPRS